MTIPIQRPDRVLGSKGYLHIAAVIDGTIGRSPLPRRSARKSALLKRLSALAEQTASQTGARIAVFSARFITPGNALLSGRVASGGYDVAVLLEVDDLEQLERLRGHDLVKSMIAEMRDQASDVLLLSASCVRVIANVDRARPGLFLFNYFSGGELTETIGVWERLADWYERKTGLTTSTLLSPTSASPITVVNHARWEIGMAHLAALQFLHPSFRRDVLARLRQAGIHSRPIFFDLAFTSQKQATTTSITGPLR
jgi:hypothetical protein